jgi:hypothetical protein
MDVFSPLFDEVTPASGTSNALSVIGEIYLKALVNLVRVRTFLTEKPNDHSLFGLQQ